MTEQPENMQQTPDQDAVELAQDQGTEIHKPTTSPDVVITDDPGPAPDPDVEQNDDENVVPLEPKENDPLSDDEEQNA